MYIVFIQHNNPFRRCKSRALWCAESSTSCLGICPQKSQPREIPPKSGDFQAGYLHQTYALTNRIKRNFRSWLRALADLEASPLPSVARKYRIRSAFSSKTTFRRLSLLAPFRLLPRSRSFGLKRAVWDRAFLSHHQYYLLSSDGCRLLTISSFHFIPRWG